MNQTIKKRIEEIKSGIVPEGYEKTSFGIFPCDWEITRIKSIAYLNKQKFNPQENKDNLVCIELEHIVPERGVLNGNTYAQNKHSLKNTFCKGDILFGKLRPYLGKYYHADQKGVCSTEIWVIRNNNTIDNNFLFQLVKGKRFIQSAQDSAFGTKMPRAEWQKVEKEKFVIPTSFREQSRIAEILMQWDKAIELQEKYIKQLEFRKKAIMQKLLTPKDEWDKKSLYNICKIETGKLDVNAMVEDGEYPFFTCSKQVYRIDQYAYECEALLMAGNGDIGDIKYYNGKFNAYQRTYVLYDFSCDIKYVMYFLQQNFDRAVMRGTQRSSMPFIKLELLKEAIIKIPKNKDFVVKILSQADIEISLQAQKLNKLLKQRKAMQQYLLTGIVRV